MAREQSDVVGRAMAYPYEAPSRAFVQLGHRTLDPAEVELDRRRRLPLLAYGSNAAPEVLARKLALSAQPVLVEPAWLGGFDVVYSAHISPYGAIPATLQRSPGTSVRVFVAHPTREQLALISSTEPNYELTRLAACRCQIEEGEVLTGLHVYLSRHGCLLLDDSEVSLAAVEARGRAFPELDEPQVLERARRRLAPDESIESFVLGNVTNPDLSRSRAARLERREARTS